MTEFQERARLRATALLVRRGVDVAFQSIPCEPDPTLGHTPGDVYLKGHFRHGVSNCEIYLYNDEAGVQVNDSWRPFERPDWNNDESQLIDGLCTFLGDLLDEPARSGRAS